MSASLRRRLRVFMNLFILRHGIAVEKTIPSFKKDSDRPLTGEGRKKTKQVARMLKRLGPSFDVVLTSPYVRARQTAEIVVDVLDAKKVLRILVNLAQGNKQKQLIDELRRRRGRVRDVLLVV